MIYVPLHIIAVQGDECEIWNTDSEDIDEAPEDAEFLLEEHVTCSNEQRALIQWLLIFILSFQAFYHLTDRAIECLYNFIKAFLGMLGRVYSNCFEIGQAFPASLNKAHILFDHKAKFRKYVTCKRCHSICFMADCIEIQGSQRVAKTCYLFN